MELGLGGTRNAHMMGRLVLSYFCRTGVLVKHAVPYRIRCYLPALFFSTFWWTQSQLLSHTLCILHLIVLRLTLR